MLLILEIPSFIAHILIVNYPRLSPQQAKLIIEKINGKQMKLMKNSVKTGYGTSVLF